MAPGARDLDGMEQRATIAAGGVAIARVQRGASAARHDKSNAVVDMVIEAQAVGAAHQSNAMTADDVQDLARSCGMSTSAFHRNFHAVTALSPIQFQKQIRLQKSRLLLLNGTDDVATAGYRVGYDSASQFNREYRRQFGLPPGRDAARLRADASTA
jgi:AraC-like DNA-binding protein